VNADVEDLRAEVAELRTRLDRALKVIGLVYDAGWEDALGTPDTNAAAAHTAYRLGLAAGERIGRRSDLTGPLAMPTRRCTRARHLEAVR
jgi:predicted RNA polymerase sigma factor